jgi:DNA-binding MarR family transcriptional regulator
LPETVDTAQEIVKIRREITDIKQSQEADMHLNEDKYHKLVSDNLRGKPFIAKVFLSVDGVTSQKEIGEKLIAKGPNVSTAIDFLVSKGLIVSLEETKNRSPIYIKPRWARALRIDDYVRTEIFPQLVQQPQVQAPTGNSDSQQNT